MQTYTHLLIGLVTGKALFPDNIWVQGACATGAILPDLVMVPKFALDRIRGKKPMTQQSDRLMAIKEMSHSLPLWVAIGLIGLFPLGMMQSHVLAFSLGGVSHIATDILSHRDYQYRKYDLTYMWPLPFSLYGFAPWEYRKGHGDLSPKPLEAVVIFILVVAYSLLWLK